MIRHFVSILAGAFLLLLASLCTLVTKAASWSSRKLCAWSIGVTVWGNVR